MTWEAHQGHGFFGFSPDKQPRWRAVVDVEQAIEESAALREAFWKWMRWPDAPPFSGGVLTEWPAREADGLAFARMEWRTVQAHLKNLEASRG